MHIFIIGWHILIIISLNIGIIAMIVASVIVLVLALIIAGIYLFFIWKKVKNEFWPALHTMISVVITIMLGVSVGFFVFNIEEDALKEVEKNDLIELLNNEIGVIEMDLKITGKDSLYLSDTILIVTLTLLPYNVIQKAGNSGLFKPVLSWRMLSLAAQIEDHNFYQSFFTSLLASPKPDENKISHVNSRINKKQKNILLNCGLLKHKLELNKNPFAEYMINK